MEDFSFAYSVSSSNHCLVQLSRHCFLQQCNNTMHTDRAERDDFALDTELGADFKLSSVVPPPPKAVGASASSRKGPKGRNRVKDQEFDGGAPPSVADTDLSKRARTDWWSWSDKMQARRTGKQCSLCGKHDTDQDLCVLLCVCMCCVQCVLILLLRQLSIELLGSL